MKIAVIGAGCSGLVTLKYLLDTYPETDIVCFEKSHSVRGCWGDQRPDFVSTSTKYTTQFSCFRKWSPDVAPEQNFEEFYRGSEFGDYLEAFAAHFDLKERIRFGVEVRHLAWTEGRWTLLLAENGKRRTPDVRCRVSLHGPGKPKSTQRFESDPGHRRSRRDSQIDRCCGWRWGIRRGCCQLSGETGNTTTRSFSPFGPAFESARAITPSGACPQIFCATGCYSRLTKAYETGWESALSPFASALTGSWRVVSSSVSANPYDPAQALRREWDLKLKARAKGGLFNVFHNKSDDFLDAVAEKRLQIIGPPVDEGWTQYFDFDQSTTLQLSPDVLVFSTGYHSRLSGIFRRTIHLKDFFLGCVHTDLPNLFLIGFARPIIGNIPSISEMQARYTVGLLSGKYKLPTGLKEKQTKRGNRCARSTPRSIQRTSTRWSISRIVIFLPARWASCQRLQPFDR